MCYIIVTPETGSAVLHGSTLLFIPPRKLAEAGDWTLLNAEMGRCGVPFLLVLSIQDDGAIKDGFRLRIQPVDATDWLNFSAGVS